METKLLGLLGRKGSGKDTVGQYFSEHHDYVPISFADALKDCLSIIFGWDRMMLEGRTPKSRQWREEIDYWWANKLDIPHFTPRYAMTWYGTDTMRQYFHEEIWVINIERKIAQSNDPVILTDIRHENELALLQHLGGSSIRVNRGPDPEWINIARLAINGNTQAEYDMKHVYNIHESEWILIDAPTDYIIDNDGSIPELYQKCESIASMLF